MKTIKGDYGILTYEGDTLTNIEKHETAQGYVYKNNEAYENGLEVCYVPELSDDTYTRQDFLDLCEGDVDRADEIFSNVDWQSPESLYEEWYVNYEDQIGG